MKEYKFIKILAFLVITILLCSISYNKYLKQESKNILTLLNNKYPDLNFKCTYYNKNKKEFKFKSSNNVRFTVKSLNKSQYTDNYISENIKKYKLYNYLISENLEHITVNTIVSTDKLNIIINLGDIQENLDIKTEEVKTLVENINKLVNIKIIYTDNIKSENIFSFNVLHKDSKDAKIYNSTTIEPFTTEEFLIEKERLNFTNL